MFQCTFQRFVVIEAVTSEAFCARAMGSISNPPTAADTVPSGSALSESSAPSFAIAIVAAVQAADAGAARRYTNSCVGPPSATALSAIDWIVPASLITTTDG